MLARKSLLLTAGVVVVSALCAVTEVRANPMGVPVTSPAPLQCTTPSGKWTITAVQGPSGEFPVEVVSCTLLPDHDGKRCFLYEYTIAGPGGTPSHVLFAISADHDLDSVAPASVVTPPGTALGDSATGFLAYAQHEYPVRVNATPSLPAEIVVVGPSSPRISTVLVKKGHIRESCLIAGPGVLGGSPFAPIVTSQSQVAAGGKCEVDLIYDAAGNVIDVQLASGADPGCTLTVGPVFIDGEELKDNRSPTGITHGSGTCTTYGPPTPSPSRTVCR
jgi:hypothetical protein